MPIEAFLIALFLLGAPGELTLSWTAVADDDADSLSGAAAAYDIRMSPEMITSETWDRAFTLLGEPVPRAMGQGESILVVGLPPGEWFYFAMKTADEVQNWSGLSNVVYKRADGERMTSVPPDTVRLEPVVDLLVQGIENVPEGSGQAAIRIRVGNAGQARAAASYVSIAIDGRQKAELYIPSLAPLASAWSAQLHTAVPTQTYVITACADCRHQVVELVEGNNCTERGH